MALSELKIKSLAEYGVTSYEEVLDDWIVDSGSHSYLVLTEEDKELFASIVGEQILCEGDLEFLMDYAQPDIPLEDTRAVLEFVLGLEGVSPKCKAPCIARLVDFEAFVRSLEGEEDLCHKVLSNYIEHKVIEGIYIVKFSKKEEDSLDDSDTKDA